MSLHLLSNASSSLHQAGEVQHTFPLQIQGTEVSSLWMLPREISDSPALCVRFESGLIHSHDCIGSWMSFGFACILQGCKHQCSHVPNLDGFHSIYIIQMAVRFQEEETLFFPIVSRQLGMLVTARKNLSNEKNRHQCSILPFLEVTKALWNILVDCCQHNDSVCKINSH